jgi:uncharacterized DUF497 family protein
MRREKPLVFDWDERKAKANLKKHRISFEEARGVFSDTRARLISDPDHSEDEDRFVLLGMSESLRMLVVCHCYRENDSIRLISARKASRHEQKLYEEHLR